MACGVEQKSPPGPPQLWILFDFGHTPDDLTITALHDTPPAR